MKYGIKIPCASILTLALLAGCATRSDNISAQHVSEAQYSHYDCEQIAREMERVDSKLSEVSEKQDSAATSDAVFVGVGLFLFWPVLFGLAATDNHKDEVGRLKGQKETLEKVAINKDCADVGVIDKAPEDAPNTRPESESQTGSGRAGDQIIE